METFGFGPSVLEPDFDLGLSEVEGGREFRPLRYGQVLFLPKLPLQGQELGGGERRPGLPVGLVFP